MWDADFRERQGLADLQRIALSTAVPDPWTAVFAPDVTPESRAAATSVLLQLAIETGTPDPAAEDSWLAFRQDFLTQRARSVLLAAFRHLYEPERTWSPSVPAAGLPLDQTTLPWVTLP